MEWIKCSDRLPNDEDPILIFVDGDCHVAHWEDDIDKYTTGIGLDCYYCGGQTSISFINDWHGNLITHWMPLPDPPKD
jgi:hypothetical protein